MKRPLLQDSEFLADVAAARRDSMVRRPPAALHIWWLGQSGFLVQWSGRHLLLDPYLSDSLTMKYAGTDKPHVRITERVVPPERLDFIDVVTSSHTHTDHLDPNTLRPLAQSNPQLILVCPEANRAMARERSGLPDKNIVGIDPSLREPSPQVRSLRFHAVPAAHESIDRDKDGRLLYIGLVVELGPFRIYHSGDTIRYPGMDEILGAFDIDAAILPINGRALERRVAGNLSGAEAAQLAREIGAGVVIPCHYDMFEFNTASPEEFTRECSRLGQPCRVLQQGERLTLDNPRPKHSTPRP